MTVRTRDFADDKLPPFLRRAGPDLPSLRLFAVVAAMRDEVRWSVRAYRAAPARLSRASRSSVRKASLPDVERQ